MECREDLKNVIFSSNNSRANIVFLQGRAYEVKENSRIVFDERFTKERFLRKGVRSILNLISFPFFFFQFAPKRDFLVFTKLLGLSTPLSTRSRDKCFKRFIKSVFAIGEKFYRVPNETKLE